MKKISLNTWTIAIICGMIYSSLWFVLLNISNPSGNQWDLPHLLVAFGTTAISIVSLYMAFKACRFLFRDIRLRRLYLAMLLLSLPLFCICYLFFWVVLVRQMVYGLKTDLQAYPGQLIYILTSLHVVIAIIVISSLYNDDVRKVELQLAKLQSLAAEAQLKMLQQQVDPHFLFNSLNILSALIPIDATRALQFSQKLSEVYWFFLRTKKEQLITVAEELALVYDYFYLIECRFEKAFTLVVHLDAGVVTGRLFIIPGTIQLLVENVIKHNAANEEAPISIEIQVTDTGVTVSNTIVRKENVPSGYGLENLASRYQLLGNKKIDGRERNGIFAVHIPLIKQAS